MTITAGAAVVLAVAAAALLLGLWLAVTYNRLVRQRNLVKEAWSGIDVQLKRRHDLVPNLVRVVEAYASHEKDVLEEVTRLRATAGTEAPSEALQHDENTLADRLSRLIAVAEAYPELKADRQFLTLHEQLVEIEDHLQYARRYYNGTVRDLNVRVESFPANVVAGSLGFESAPFFELTSATERHAPKVGGGETP